MNDIDKLLWQQAIKRVTWALAALEEAIDAQDDVKIEARAYELRQMLLALETLMEQNS